MFFGKKKGGRLKNASENLTGAANFHLFVPIFVNAAIANGAIDEPTEVATLKLPGGTLFLSIGITFFDSPAGLAAVLCAKFA